MPPRSSWTRSGWRAPDRSSSILTLSGLPAVLILSWVFDLTSSGIQRTEPADGGSGRAFRIAGLVASIVLAVLVGWSWWYFLR